MNSSSSTSSINSNELIIFGMDAILKSDDKAPTQSLQVDTLLPQINVESGDQTKSSESSPISYVSENRLSVEETSRISEVGRTFVEVGEPRQQSNLSSFLVDSIGNLLNPGKEKILNPTEIKLSKESLHSADTSDIELTSNEVPQTSDEVKVAMKNSEDPDNLFLGKMMTIYIPYHALELDEMELEGGDEVELTELPSSGDDFWLKGINRGWGVRNGQMGYFPRHCTIKPSNQEKEVEWVVAQYDYEPSKSDELYLSIGDIIQVLETPEGGWWKGKSQDQCIGWFPANLVVPHEVPNIQVKKATNKTESKQLHPLNMQLLRKETKNKVESPKFNKRVNFQRSNTSDAAVLSKALIHQDSHFRAASAPGTPIKENGFDIPVVNHYKMTDSQRITSNLPPASILKSSTSNVLQAQEATSTQSINIPSAPVVVDKRKRALSAPNRSPMSRNDSNESFGSKETVNLLEYKTNEEKNYFVKPILKDSVRKFSTRSSVYSNQGDNNIRLDELVKGSDGSNWEDSLEPSMLETLTPAKRKQMSAIWELIQTEKDYLRDLNLILEVIYLYLVVLQADAFPQSHQ